MRGRRGSSAKAASPVLCLRGSCSGPTAKPAGGYKPGHVVCRATACTVCTIATLPGRALGAVGAAWLQAALSAGLQESICISPKSKPPLREQRGFGDKNPGDDLLSHGLSHTTIGAAAFHFRVRDGIGWFHSANFTRERVGGSQWLLLKGPQMDVRSLSKGSAYKRQPLVGSCDVACTWVHRHVMSAKAT